MESGRAIQLISVDPDTGKFKIEEEAIQVLSGGNVNNLSMNASNKGLNLGNGDNLEENENKIAIIGIAGKYRTGKSLLMNLLSGNTENNFEVSASVKACTRGIWIYSEPITIK
jgi:pantothenate kinase